jgi:hypothetical protein
MLLPLTSVFFFFFFFPPLNLGHKINFCFHIKMENVRGSSRIVIVAFPQFYVKYDLKKN